MSDRAAPPDGGASSLSRMSRGHDRSGKHIAAVALRSSSRIATMTVKELIENLRKPDAPDAEAALRDGGACLDLRLEHIAVADEGEDDAGADRRNQPQRLCAASATTAVRSSRRTRSEAPAGDSRDREAAA